MISLRKCTGLVIQEMTAHHKNIPFSDVNSEDFVEYIHFCHRQTLSKNICRILFKMELDANRTNLFNSWLIRKSPLLTVIFPEYNETYRARKSVYEYPTFDLMTEDWPIGINEIFQPSSQAINEMTLITSIVTEVDYSKMERRGRPDFESCRPPLTCPETRNVLQRSMPDEDKLKMDALQTSLCENDLKPVLKLNICAPWLKIDNLHSVRILEGLQSFRKNEDLCDIRFETDDGTIVFGHKNVLMAGSTYFRAMLSNFDQSNKDVVNIRELDSAALQLLVDYIYTGEISVTKENVQVLLPAANILQLDFVSAACAQFLQKQLDASLADLQNCTELLSSFDALIKKNFLSVNFKNILNLNYICYRSSCVRWFIVCYGLKI